MHRWRSQHSQKVYHNYLLRNTDVETTKEIANVRIHVERVIGLTRNKYTMLQDTIPITLLQKDSNSVPIVDKIVHVSCALVNLSSSVVPIQ